jgi:hypothetical protein
MGKVHGMVGVHRLAVRIEVEQVASGVGCNSRHERQAMKIRTLTKRVSV